MTYIRGWFLRTQVVRRAACVAAWLLLGILGLTSVALAQEIRYIYDDLSRLVGVVDQQGNVAEYVYDAVGNILEIRRLTANPSVNVAITLVSPTKGPVGATVQILGKGFSITPAENQVAFNGTPASVMAATATSVTTTVPSGATSGPVTVTTPLGSAASPEPFIVVSPVAVAPLEVAVFPRLPVQFNANVPVTWRVNLIDGGNATVGTITTGGLYQAPAAVPAPATVTVTALSQQDPRLSATAQVTILTPPSPLVAQPVSLGFPPTVPPPLVAAPLVAPLVSLGVVPPPPPAPANVLMTTTVSLAIAPVITTTMPNAATQGAANLTFTLQGVGFTGATDVQFLLNGAPDPTITVTGLTASPDGTQATGTLSVDPQAALGPRVITIVTPNGTSGALGIGGNLFQVTSP